MNEDVTDGDLKALNDEFFRLNQLSNKATETSYGRLTDAELIALSAIVNLESVQMAGDNQQRAHQGYAPAHVTDTGRGVAGEKLYDELFKRGILP